MKKYFAAGAVAVMVFAFAAMAASLNVQNSTLATGVAEVQGCGTLTVDGWGAEMDNDTTGHVRFVQDLAEACGNSSDKVAFVRVYDASDKEVGSSAAIDLTESATGNINLRTGGGDYVPTEDIHSLKVLVHSKNL